MQRLIVTSATYRQSSAATAAERERDPENRLLARGPRQRLPAELIRDTALAASGLLNDKIGGPSVLPYQPAGLWEEMAFGEGFSAQKYVQSHGPDLYRRGMYTFWKRTAPPASLTTFDAPDRETCTARRAFTNTPLQALTLMNDPTYVEAARALAQRSLLEGGSDESARIAYAFRLATARKPSGKETGVLTSLLNSRLDAFRKDRRAAAKLVAVGESARDARLDAAELAAWTTVASAILESRRDDHQAVSSMADPWASTETRSSPDAPPALRTLRARHRHRRARVAARPRRAGRRRTRRAMRRPAASPGCRTSRPAPSASSSCTSPAARRRSTCSTTSRSSRKFHGTELPDSVRQGQRITGMTIGPDHCSRSRRRCSSSRSTASRARGSASCCRTPRRSSTTSPSSRR